MTSAHILYRAFPAHEYVDSDWHHDDVLSVALFVVAGVCSIVVGAVTGMMQMVIV